MQFIASFDTQITKFIEPIRTPFLTKIFTIITYLGEWPIILGAAIIISAVLVLKRKKIQDAVFIFITLGGLGTAFILKELIHRARPLNGLISETSFSFPSAHAVVSVVFYGFVIYLLWQNIKNAKVRALKIFIGAALVAAIGFSRLYLGAHYFSDVLAGYLIGIIWLAIGIFLSVNLPRRRKLFTVYPQK